MPLDPKLRLRLFLLNFWECCHAAHIYRFLANVGSCSIYLADTLPEKSGMNPE